MESGGSTRTGHSGGFARFARNSAFFTLGSVAGKIIAVVVVPVLTRLLAPAEFGRYDVLTTLSTALTSIAVLGLDVASTRLYPLEKDHRGLFGTWSVISLAVGVPVAVTLTVAGPAMSRALFGTDALAIGFAFVGVSVLGNLFQVVGLTALRNEGRPLLYAGVSSGAFVTGGALIITLVTWTQSANAAMAGVAGGMVVGGASAIIVTRKVTIGRPSTEARRALFRLGLPLVPALTATWVSEFVNRAILLGVAGSAEVGYLSVALRFGSVGLLFVTGFQLAWQPRAFALGESAEGLQGVAADARRIVIASSAAMLPVGLLAPELMTLVSGTEYLSAVPAVGLSLTQAIGFALFIVATMPASISQRMRDVGLAAGLASVTSVLANLLLAPLWESTGTALALVIGQLAGVGLAIALSRHAVRVPLDWPRMIVVSTSAASLMSIATLVDGVPLVVRAGLGAVFVGVLWLEGGLGELLAYARRRFSG